MTRPGAVEALPWPTRTWDAPWRGMRTEGRASRGLVLACGLGTGDRRPLAAVVLLAGAGSPRWAWFDEDGGGDGADAPRHAREGA